MARFRKKPIVVDAVQWDGRHPVDGVRSVGCSHCWPKACTNSAHNEFPSAHHGEIDTPEGISTASPGDWIITGVRGEKYPCKPDIFAATYERAEKDTFTDILKLTGDLYQAYYGVNGNETERRIVIEEALGRLMDAWNRMLE